MSLALELLAIPFLACLVLAGIHAYLGLHVLARGVIFVDLALAQTAALGLTSAVLAGHAPGSRAADAYAMVFTVAGAAVFALTRPRRGAAGWHAIPQEATIGIVYAVAAALTLMVLDRVPQGGEQIKQLLVGALLGVSAADVARLAALYALLGIVHWICRRPLLALSTSGAVPHARAWDFVFYVTFGLVVVSSVRIAGVLLVFAYLIVPAVAGAWLAATVARRLLIGWAVGGGASIAGLCSSYVWDLPTGATVVAVFGAVLVLIGIVRALVDVATKRRPQGPLTLSAVGVVLGVMLALAGLALVTFPHADHVWLDGLEHLAPAVQRNFLTESERQAYDDSRASIARGAVQLEELRGLEADVRWGATTLPAERQERLRQYLAGRGEIVAGDRLVLRTLRARARERQRFVVGIPLALVGVALGVTSLAARRSRVDRRTQIDRRTPTTAS